jgi:hypothetical protein
MRKALLLLMHQPSDPLSTHSSGVNFDAATLLGR